MVAFQPPIQHTPPMSTLLPKGSCASHSLHCGLLPPSIVRHLCCSRPHSLMGSPIIFIIIYYYFYFLSIYVEIIAFLPSHCGGSFPSQWSSSRSHCWAPPLLTVGLLPFSLLGCSPSHCWAPPVLTVSLGLLPFAPSRWGSSIPQHGGPFASHSLK